MKPDVLLSCQDVGVDLGSHRKVAALRGVNLQLRTGERLALVGSNGSGKTTLLRALHGLQPPAQGQVTQAPGLRLAMLFQRPHVLRLSVLNNVRLGLWLQGQTWRATRHRARDALACVGLADQAERPGRALSGGQQQRLALARAWAQRPHVWLLDEPTASLDPHAKREVEALISAFAAETLGEAGQAVPALVFSSHSLAQVKRLATRVIYLEGGRVLADLPVADFFNHAVLGACSPQAQAFVAGEMP